METKEAQLLQRIEEFSMDVASAAFPFSARLAKENNWSGAFARRAVAEYKRFVYLAMVAGHPVSPSDAVDQVWHLHLTYTQSYWKHFCGEVLQRPFHHQPTKGGMEEHSKFADWYAQTLASYRKFFGENPPGDIWPNAQVPAHPEYVRVNAQDHWVIPKLRLPWLKHARWLGYASALALLAAGCRSASGGWKSPFDLTGPDFLALYIASLMVVVVAAAIWRRALRVGEVEQPPSASEPDPYAVAYLNGGEALMVNAAVVSLAHRRILKVADNPAHITVTCSLPADAHPMERALFAGVGTGGGQKLRDVRPALEQPVAAVVEAARRDGWALSHAQAEKARWWPLLLALCVPAMGMIKVVVGVQRNKPVFLLVFLLVVSTISILVAFARRPRATRLGDSIVAKMKSEYAGMRGPQIVDTPASALAVPMALGLFGMTILADTSLADMRRSLGPPPGSSGCGSSCGGGGGSDGGGGGCGGGSGCGGCGGGGGD